MSYSLAVQYFSVPTYLPIKTLTLSEIGLYAVIHSLNNLPDKKFQFTEKGLAHYAMGDIPSVKNALHGLCKNNVVKVVKHSPEKWFEVEELFLCTETSRVYNNGFALSQKLTLAAKGVLVAMQIVLSSAGRVLDTFLKACRNTITKYIDELKAGKYLMIQEERDDEKGTFDKNRTYLCVDGEAVMELFASSKPRKKSGKAKNFTVSVAQNTVAQDAVAQNPTTNNNIIQPSNDSEVNPIVRNVNKDISPCVLSVCSTVHTSSINHTCGAGKKDEACVIQRRSRREETRSLFRKKITKEELNDQLLMASGGHNDVVNDHEYASKIAVNDHEYASIIDILTDAYVSVLPLNVCGVKMSIDSVREILDMTDAECVATAMVNICKYAKRVRHERNYLLTTIIRQTQTRGYRERNDEREVKITNGLIFSASEDYAARNNQRLNKFQNFPERDYTPEQISAIELAMRRRH